MVQKEKRVLLSIFNAYLAPVPHIETPSINNNTVLNGSSGQSQRNSKLDMSSIIVFAKDFDICPHIIDSSLCLQLARMAIDTSAVTQMDGGNTSLTRTKGVDLGADDYAHQQLNFTQVHSPNYINYLLSNYIFC